MSGPPAVSPGGPKEDCVQTVKPVYGREGNVVRLFAPSGYSEKYEAIALAISRLQLAGFAVDNQTAAYRKMSRFAGTDAQRAGDFQAIIDRRVQLPKILLALRGGYGSMRILPLVDWASLGSMMQECGTLLLGYSDITAIQLALLARGKTTSFAGPMLVGDLGVPEPSSYMLQGLVQCLGNPSFTVVVEESQISQSIEGVFWGGNLSILSALVGSNYMPRIRGGILFIEDVSEQPYRIERMLQTLYLAGILSQQKAIVLGNFNLDNDAKDSYDANYTFSTVVERLRRILKIPVLTSFPFGHVADKVTMPLGAFARIDPHNSGYTVNFSHYPYFNVQKFHLEALGRAAEETPALCSPANGSPLLPR
ncbi:MAG: LD-carboxypeptidase [Neisseriaceae bacterium]